MLICFVAAPLMKIVGLFGASTQPIRNNGENALGKAEAPFYSEYWFKELQWCTISGVCEYSRLDPGSG